MIKVRVSARGLPYAVRRLAGDVDKAVIEALQRTARFGHTAVVQAGNRARPKPVASGSFRQAWTVSNTKKGAVLGNSVQHAIFVERGRGPGPVPLAPLVEWIKQKRISLVDVRVPKAPRRRAGTQGPRQSPRHRKLIELAKRIALKIRKRGFRGRWPLKSVMPRIRKRANREIKVGIKAALKAAAARHAGGKFRVAKAGKRKAKK